MTNALAISTPEKLLAALRTGLAFVALEMLGSTLSGVYGSPAKNRYESGAGQISNFLKSYNLLLIYEI